MDDRAERALAGKADRAMAEKATALADAIERTIGPWVIASIRRVAATQRHAGGDQLLVVAEDAARRANEDVVPQVRALLATDIDEQTTTPLALIRAAVRYPTEVLEALGIRPVARDEFAERAFPADVYGLSPAAFGDVAPELATPGLEWGAAKAYIHLTRRRADGST